MNRNSLARRDRNSKPPIFNANPIFSRENKFTISIITDEMRGKKDRKDIRSTRAPCSIPRPTDDVAVVTTTHICCKRDFPRRISIVDCDMSDRVLG